MTAEKLLEDALKGYETARLEAHVAADRTYDINVAALQRKQIAFVEVYNKLVAAEDEDEIESLEEEAADLAEYLEIEFVYQRKDGEKRNYTPEAWWEPSGGCEWVESAQSGYDYGWNI